MDTEIVGIRFKKAGKIYYFTPEGKTYNRGQQIVVETARGVELGNIVISNRLVKEDDIIAPLKPVLRLASPEDLRTYEENKKLAEEAGVIFEEKVKSNGLEMILSGSEYTLDRNKLIFYFTADGRRDFRELVRDLASVFKTRIELRQIGVRDEAKSLGGLGCCGRPLCCSTWLGDFQSVSIKMAKDQNLSLNPTKISGICGRLFCCLNYEHQTYEDMLAILPNIGSIVKTSDGKAIRGFEVEDKNGLSVPLSTKIVADKIVINLPKDVVVKKITYAWKPFTDANLVNKDMLPASTFLEKF